MMPIRTEVVSADDLVTVGLVDSIVSRAERILERDLSAPVVLAALMRLTQAKPLEQLLDRAATAATVAEFDVTIKETSAQGDHAE